MTTPFPAAAAGMAPGQDVQHLPGSADESLAQQAIDRNPAAGLSHDPNRESPNVAQDPPQHIQAALMSIVRAHANETEVVRRHHVRRFQQALRYWDGQQNLIWDQRNWKWTTPFETELNRAQGTQAVPEYYIQNVYLALGLSVIAAITQSAPSVRFNPVSVMSQDDVSTAKAANRLIKLIHKNNQMPLLRIYLGYLMWTQGFCAAYVRYKVDGERFGYRPQEIWGESTVQVLPERFDCPACGSYAEAAGTGIGLGATASQCPDCGSQLGPQNYAPPLNATIPSVQQVQMVPNGAEVISFYGGLNVLVPPQARDFSECYYLILREEIHKAPIRAAYPLKADKIGSGMAAGGEDSYERLARLALLDNYGQRGAVPFGNLVTYQRAWLKPEALWAHDDKSVREELLQMYPEGVMVASADNDLFLEARAERMGDHWRIMRAVPGEGMYTQALGDPSIPIQTQINDSCNIKAQHRVMAAAPTILVDSRYIDTDALARKRMMPGSYTPVLMKNQNPGAQLSTMMFQPKFSLDQNVAEGDVQQLIDLAQFVTGALPTILGTGNTNLKTATSYTLARDQAMGRLSLVAQMHRILEADIATLAVQCAQKNRLDDIEQVVKTRDGEFSSDWIHLAELRGNAIAEPEADSDYPVTFSQIREGIISVLQSQDPVLIARINDPNNANIINRYIGVPQLKDPNEDNKNKQFMEIDQLVASAPYQDPQSGQITPTVPIDPLVDDDNVHIETIRGWAVDEAGLNCKRDNPAGYANVMAHLLQHIANESLKQATGVAGERNAGTPSQAASPAAPAAQEPQQ